MRHRIQPLALVALAVVVAYWAGTVIGWHASARAQTEWSHGRIIADPPIIMAVVSRERLANGTVVGPARQDAYVGAEDDNRVADYVIDPGRSYVTACGFRLIDDVVYWADVYLPITVRPRS